VEAQPGEIRDPDMVRETRSHREQEIGVLHRTVSDFLVFPPAAPIGLESKLPHHPTDSFLIKTEFPGDPTVAITRMIMEDDLDLLFQGPISAQCLGMIIQGRAGHTKLFG